MDMIVRPNLCMSFNYQRRSLTLMMVSAQLSVCSSGCVVCYVVPSVTIEQTTKTNKINKTLILWLIHNKARFQQSVSGLSSLVGPCRMAGKALQLPMMGRKEHPSRQDAPSMVVKHQDLVGLVGLLCWLVAMIMKRIIYDRIDYYNHKPSSQMIVMELG